MEDTDSNAARNFIYVASITAVLAWGVPKVFEHLSNPAPQVPAMQKDIEFLKSEAMQARVQREKDLKDREAFQNEVRNYLVSMDNSLRDMKGDARDASKDIADSRKDIDALEIKTAMQSERISCIQAELRIHKNASGHGKEVEKFDRLKGCG